MTDEEKKKLYAHPGWESCTFEGAELSTLKLGLQATFREKLEWLEEAETLSERFRQSRANYPPATKPTLETLNDSPAPQAEDRGEGKAD